MPHKCLLVGPHPENLTSHPAQGSGCWSKEYNQPDPATIFTDGTGDKDISEIFESCDPNLLGWMERLLLISKKLGHVPKVWVGDMLIMNLTWSQVLHNHMVKHNVRCSACCHHFRFLSFIYLLLRCCNVLHTDLIVCLCFYFFYSLFPQQTSSGKLSGCRSFHLLVQQQGFYHFHSDCYSLGSVLGTLCGCKACLAAPQRACHKG